MDWSLFWTIALQVVIGAVVLAIAALAISFAGFMIRAAVKPKAKGAYGDDQFVAELTMDPLPSDFTAPYYKGRPQRG